MMDQGFSLRQGMRNIHSPGCLIGRTISKLEQNPASVSLCCRIRRPILRQKNLGPNMVVEVHCVGVTGSMPCIRKQSSACVRNLSLGPSLRCMRSGQTISRDNMHIRSDCEERRWSLLERAASISCNFSRTTLQSHQSSGEGKPLIQDKAHKEESNRLTSSTLPGADDWLAKDFGFASFCFKLWFRSVCSTVLVVSLCVPQALGAGALLADLALNNCGTPEVDYSPLKGLEGVALKEKLHDLVKDHKVYTYLQVWDALKVLDEAKDDPDSVIDIYSQQKKPKSDQGKTTGWNREHLWPRSFGLVQGQPGFSDLHNLRPADTNVNSSRGNKFYGDCSTQAVECTVPANKEAAADTGTNKDIWMPPGKVRGDIARAVFYMAVRYGSEQPPGVKALSLSNSPDVEYEVMGILKDLVRWNEFDPPSDSERERNNKVCSLYQHNRNPFVDHPEFVNAIWKDGSMPLSDTPEPPPLPREEIIAWINELHYDNSGADQNEFVEVIMKQDVDPATLKLVLYNNQGNEYRSLSLGDSKEFTRISSIGDGFSLYVTRLPSGTLQNGPGDGLALVDEDRSDGRVIQTLSYEGTFKAVDGPAKGQESSDIGLEEGGETPVGSSLGLIGTGNQYGDFKWSVFKLGASPGTLNPGQTLLSAPPSK